MQKFAAVVLAYLLYSISLHAQYNPIIKGWYADPEGTKYGDTYWVFPKT
jgi:hypothetical protein